MADRDGIKDRDEEDDLPVLDPGETEADEATATDGAEDDDGGDDGDGEYDIRAELDEHDRHVLDQLSDEELAALADDEDEDEDGGDGDDDGEDDPAQGAAEDDKAPSDTEAGSPPPEPEPAQVELTQEDIDRINEKGREARKAATDKWRDGDLTDEELDQELEAAEQAREQARQEIIDQRRQEIEEQAFERRQQEFTEVARSYLKTEYPELASPEHLRAFNEHVERVTASARYAGKTYREMLEAAHQLYVAEGRVLGVSVPPLKSAAKSDAAAPGDGRKPAAKPKAAKPATVPTLARVPAAATNATSEGKWGSLQARFDAARTADEREAILAGLSDEEAEAFASMEI